jgi:hypothetical protein
MKDLEVWGSEGNAYPAMGVMVAALPERARASVWDVINFVYPNGDDFFEIAGESTEPFYQLLNTGERIAGERFFEIAEKTPQIIWATFRAFDSTGAVTSWLELDGIDSTFWRIRTTDLATRQAVIRTFKDVRQTKW